MKRIMITRWMHWRKQLISMLCWLLLPIAATIIFVSIANQWQSDTQIPIGLVVEDQSEMANQLVQVMDEDTLFEVKKLEMNEALKLLEQHELDSVFVIEEGFQEKIKNNDRDRVIKSYYSNMSLGYTPTKEAIASHIQDDASSSKAAHTVKEMVEQYGGEQGWTWEEIVATSKKIKEEESLLHSTFSFINGETSNADDHDGSLWNVWGIWAAFALLSTFFLFDWVVKERHSSVKIRLSGFHFSFKRYLQINMLLYLLLLVVFDGMNILLLSSYFDQPVHTGEVLALISFRIVITLLAFLVAMVFKTTFYYYVTTITLSIFFAVVGGAIIPMSDLSQSWSWITHLSPIDALLGGDFASVLLILLLILFVIWSWRKERTYA